MPAKKQAPKPIQLTDEQCAVVETREGVVRCMASPGSGKSSVLVARYVNLVESGVDPNQILSLTFTATAAKNLRDRVESFVGKLPKTRISGASTFHGVGLALVQEERDEFSYPLAEFPLAAEPAANKISGDAARRHDLDGRVLRSFISVSKRNRVRASSALKAGEAKLSAPDIKLAMGYLAYEKKLRAEGLLDFDGLILETVELLEKDAKVRARHQYRYVQVDESQDCCEIEWAMLRALTEKHRNLCAVGDANQNIFSFRGSNARIFVEMETMFPGTQKLFLSRNFRSSPQIVEFIKPIGTVPELCDKFTSSNADGPVPVVRGFATSAEETAWVVSQIQENSR